jgi:hypothetical protein
MNLEDIVQQIPEAKRILDLSWRNAKKDGSSRKYGELTVKELESFTKAIIRHEQSNGQYVIIDLRNMDYMKDKDGNINFYDDEEEACDVCGMYEFEDAWVCKLIYNYKELDHGNT